MNLFDKDLRHEAMQVAAQTSGGNPMGVRDRALGRELAAPGPVRRSKASSRTIRRAAAKQRKLEARRAKLNKGGFA